MSAPAEPQEVPAFVARGYAVEEVSRLPVALALVRSVIADMRTASGGTDLIDPNEPFCWADALEWIVEHMEEDNNDARSALIKAGWIKPGGEPGMSGRRGFLAGIAAGAVTLPVAANGVTTTVMPSDGVCVSHPPDAYLPALCAEFMAINAESQAWNASPINDDDYSDDLNDRWHSALEKLSATSARTFEGFQAKARATHAAMLQSCCIEEWGTEEKAAFAVLADLAGVSS